MSSNQRENERKARKNAKTKKKMKLLWILIAAIVAVIVVLKVCEVDFPKLFSFSKEDSGYSVSVDDAGFPYKIDTGENTVLSVVGNKIAVLSSSSYTVIDSSSAEELINDEHRYANPILKTSGGYSVIFDQGSTSYRLDSQKENIYENSTEDEILCADVSDTGAVAVATALGNQKSRVQVFSKSFSEKMNYEIKGGYITSVAIDDRGKSVAFVVMSSENAEIKSTLYTMNINDAEPKAHIDYNGSAVLDIHFVSSALYVVGSDFVSVVSSLEKESVVYEKGSINTLAYCYNPADYLIIAYSAYTGAANSKLAYVKQNGKIKTTVEIDGVIKDVSASGNEMSALTSNEAVSYRLSNGKKEAYIKLDDSFTDIQQLSSKIYAKHHSYLEIIND
ncbi:hypothetical protein IMSAG250_00625 [Clostridiales bacterium]|nr:hypothetical protein IMSAG250_00625 [Clostridiales bacterium]